MKEKKSFITEPLGLFGWKNIESVILAALATESPMLLIGKHGSAKSFILERLAEALNLEFRSYNASLINYDDLVGIPIPIDNNTKLDYISNPNSIWDAEVVFVDEINRTKPELQNKLFPIIYDKRVQGQKLEKLKYRWAAMNPANIDDEDDDLTYFGASPLDPALADRFPFLIEVPDWTTLSDSDREKMLKDMYLGRHEFKINIFDLINKTKEEMNNIISKDIDEINKYILSLMDLLGQSVGYISARRATMLLDTLISIIAAEKVLKTLDDRDIDFKECAITHILYTIPYIANKRIDKTLLINIANQAIKYSKLDNSSAKDIMRITDPIERLKYVIKNKKELDNSLVCDVITSSISKLENPIRRGMALITYLSFRNESNIYASVMETLANEIRCVLSAKKNNSLELLEKKKIADKVDALLNKLGKDYKHYQYLSNLMYSFLPDDYKTADDALKLYRFFIDTASEVNL